MGDALTVRSFKIDASDWERFKQVAAGEGESPSALLRSFVSSYETEECAECAEHRYGVIVDAEGEPVLDDDGEPQDCSCDEADDDYDPNCVCSEDDAPPFGIVMDPETGEPVVDEDGNTTPCSCEEDADDYDPNCDCSEDEAPAETGQPGQTAAIIGTGALSDSKDPATQAAVNRVKELLEEGAVGVSVALDMDPDTMPDPDELDALIAEGRWEEAEALLADALQRLRHLAIVDTAAFADSRLTLESDGTVSGPMVFEGIWTGDMRFIPYGAVTWETTLPIPIIWDREDGDHTGTVVGSITSVERVDDMASAVHTSEHAIAAAAETSLLDSVPASYFAERRVTADTPFTIGAPDARGLRPVYGIAAPRGVCHRSGDGSTCFQYPGDVDPKRMRGFHTGTALTLDNGTTARVGAITLGGMHVDTALASRGVGVHDLGRYREDANQVFALVRAYETPHGLAVAGVVVPGVNEKQLAQARACAPSVELWPSGRGRTLAGIHLVPSPAWPVAASGGSGGSALEVAGTAPVQVEDPPAARTRVTYNSADVDVSSVMLADVKESLARVEKVLALLAADAITDVPLPEDTPEG